MAEESRKNEEEKRRILGKDGMNISPKSLAVSALRYLPLLSALACSIFAFLWLLSPTNGSLVGIGWHGSCYDSLAKSLLQGRADVDPDLIGIEAFSVNGHTFMYFGLFPALLRLPFVVSGSQLVGYLSPLSCFTAGVVSIAAFSALCMPHARRNPFMAAWALLGFTLGTPLFFLGLSASIYHEAIMWALAGALWSVTSLLYLFSSGRRKIPWLALCAIAAAVALLARVTFGFPAYLCVAAGFFASVREGGRKKIVGACLAVLPAIGAVLVQMWYNYIRFDSIFIVALYKPGVFSVNLDDFGGMSNWRRIPELLALYFLPSMENFSLSFPFVLMANPTYSDPSLFLSYLEPVAALSVTAPWLVVFAIAGGVSIIRRPVFGTALVAALLIGCWYPILSLYSITERYVAEFIPALVFLVAAAWRAEAPWMRSVCAKIATICLIAISIAATILSATAWPKQVSRDFVSDRIQRIMAGEAPLLDG